MSMKNVILNFAKQFSWEPVVENAGRFERRGRYIVAGMGGSHLAGGILKSWKPTLPLVVHHDYGLPFPDGELRWATVIASSYSGNTEEMLDIVGTAVRKNLSVVALSTGGRLLETARERGIPYLQIPSTGIQPRSALGFSVKALLAIAGDEDGLREASDCAHALDPQSSETTGRALAERLRGSVPIIYASQRNESIAYNWKIKFNETGKIPAFWNVLPELNHNEMNGFDVKDATRELSHNFYFIFLRDPADHPRILKRMEVVEQLYKDRGLRVEVMDLVGDTAFEKIFSSLVLADWAAYYTAEGYGLESEQVPMIEEFKKLITMDNDG